MQEFNFWQFMAGIAVFVFAMSLIESSLKNLAGRSFKKFLQKQSQHLVKMMVASTVVTTFLQSSSIVLLMILSFVGAGLINMRGALAAMLGSNLGTTLDSWVIATIGFKINLDALAYPFLAIALFGLIFSKKNSKVLHATTFLIGFAFIFISLEWLKSSADKSIENSLSSLMNLNYLFFVPIGFLITAIIQSSLATVAITLAALYNHLIPFESAVSIVIGSETGTTIKFLIGSAGGIPDKKRVAWGNFILNVATMFLAIIMLHPLIYFIQNIIAIHDPLLGLVAFQTSINLLSVIIFFPLLGVAANFLNRFFKEHLTDKLTSFIRNSTAVLPGDELELAEKETTNLVTRILELNKRALDIATKENKDWIKNIARHTPGPSSYNETYVKIKMLQGEILRYITEIPGTEMSEAEVEQTGKLISIARHALRSAKNLKDIRHNLEEFKSTVNDDLFNLFTEMKGKAGEFYNEFQHLINEPGKINSELIINFTDKNRKQYDDAIANMLVALKEKKISELDSSNLVNVYREIYSSNKALIRALADLSETEAEDKVLI